MTCLSPLTPPPTITATKKQRPCWWPAWHHLLQHKRKTYLNVFQVNHCMTPPPPTAAPALPGGNLFSRNEFQVASFEALPPQTPGTICYGTGRVTRYSHLDRHPSLQEDMCVFSLVSSLALSCFLNCSHIYPASQPALPV